jgi:hypothetical protein
VNNRCPSAEAFRCLLESAWDECGGMASTPELGAFVRQTVGHKLAERRALTSRGRVNTVSVPAPTNPGATASLASATALAPGPVHADASRATEDGTKTAISAAVPAAERIAAARTQRFGRRTVGLAALATVSVAALAVMSMTMSSSEETRAESATRPGVARQEVEAPPDLGVRPAPREVEPSPAPPMAPPPSTTTPIVNTEPVVIREPVRRASSDSSDDDRAASDDADTETGSRQRKAGSRQKASQHKSKSKASSRSGTLRTTNHGSSTTKRVLPLPQPSERQQRAKAAAGQSEGGPLNLAPDPYDR